MKKLIPIVVVIMIAVLALSACGGGPAPSGGAQTAPTEASQKPASKPTDKPAAQPPAQQPAPVDNPTAEPEAIELANVTTGLSELNSYKASFNMTFEGKENDQTKTGTMSFTEEFVKEPPAKRVSITGFGALMGGTGSAEDAIQTIEVGGKQYSQIGTLCTQVTAESGPQASAMFDPSTIIGGVRGGDRVGNETVNGVPTVHYKIDVSGLETLGYVNGGGDVWIAEPGDYVVKYTFEATGKDQFFGTSTDEGTIKWVYELTDVNQPINIQPPADCGGAAEDIPIMADAQDRSAIGSLSTYTSPSTFEEVVAFYEKEMKAQGWTEAEGSGMSVEGMSSKSYSKDGRTVQIMITADSSGGKTSVMITEEKQ